jgi:hypothetical protein
MYGGVEVIVGGVFNLDRDSVNKMSEKLNLKIVKNDRKIQVEFKEVKKAKSTFF